MKRLFISAFALLLILAGNAQEKQTSTPLIIQSQGSFAVGGTIITHAGIYNTHHQTSPEGQTIHGDHAYVAYQIPVNTKPLPLVFLHGAGQSGKTWETTPDVREGFATLFLRRGYATYVIDQPRRGRAGWSTVPEQIAAKPVEQYYYENFRMGCWPQLHEDGQFPKDSASLDQFFRQMTPNTGAFDGKVIASAMSALFHRMGNGILVTHSQGGGPGWLTAILNSKVKAIVSYEPGSDFVFPEDEIPAPMKCSDSYGFLDAKGVPMSEFKALTRIPIIIYYGDYIPEKPTMDWAADHWRVRLQMARLFVDCINRHGGHAEVVHLPDLGIKGNSHFLFAEKNNLQLAKMLDEWINKNVQQFE